MLRILLPRNKKQHLCCPQQPDELANTNNLLMKNKITLFIALVASASLFAAVSPKEKEALVKLYQATNGSQWTHSWDLNAPVNSWFGVVLKNDKVVSLDLSNNHLVGELPAAVTDLSNLQKLKSFV